MGRDEKRVEKDGDMAMATPHANPSYRAMLTFSLGPTLFPSPSTSLPLLLPHFLCSHLYFYFISI